MFTARRLELCEVVQTTLLYLHPDSCIHSYLSPLPYQVTNFLWGSSSDKIRFASRCMQSDISYDLFFARSIYVKRL